MAKTKQRASRAQAGDGIAVTGHRVGEPERVGEILEVLGEEAAPHYRVRWDDGHESVFYPGDDARITPRKTA